MRSKHEPSLGARRAKRSLRYASKIKSLPKLSTHDANAFRTFGLCIKQFLIASNIDFSDIFGNTFVFCATTMVYQTTEDLLDLMHLKKGRTAPSVYQQHFMALRDRYTDGSRVGNYVACATVFPPDTVTSMRLPTTAFIFTAEDWANIKALKQRFNCIQMYYFLQTAGFTTYVAGTFLV